MCLLPVQSSCIIVGLICNISVENYVDQFCRNMKSWFCFPSLKFICRRNCEQYTTSTNSSLVWSWMEGFDGKLLVIWSCTKAILFRNLSEAEEYGCCYECEVISISVQSAHLVLSCLSPRLPPKRENNGKRRRPSLKPPLFLVYGRLMIHNIPWFFSIKSFVLVKW